MGTFVTQPTTPELYDDKSPAPGAQLPTGWTVDNVTEADNLNDIQAALLDCRAAIRVPPSDIVPAQVQQYSSFALRQTFMANVLFGAADTAKTCAFTDFNIPAVGAITDYEVTITLRTETGTPSDPLTWSSHVTDKFLDSFNLELSAAPGGGCSVIAVCVIHATAYIPT